VPVFLRKFNISNGAVGFLMTLDNYVNMLIVPLMGQISDRSTRWGRRFPYIIIGAPIAALGAALIPLAAMQSLPLLIGSMLMMTLSMAFFRAPAIALLGDFFDPDVRARVNGIMGFMALFATIVAFLIGGYLYKINPFYPFVVVAIGMVLILAGLTIVLKEPETPYQSSSSDEHPSLLTTLRMLANGTNRNGALILAVLLVWLIGLTPIQAFFTLFGRVELGLNEGTVTQLQSFYPLAGMIFAIPGGYLGTHLGRRRTILICFAAIIGFFLMFLSLPSEALIGAAGFLLSDPSTWFATPALRIVIFFLMGMGGSVTVIMVNMLPLLFDTAPSGQIGRYTGLYYLFGSISAVVAPPLGGFLIDMTGSYRSIFMVAPFWLLLAFILMLFVKETKMSIIETHESSSVTDLPYTDENHKHNPSITVNGYQTNQIPKVMTQHLEEKNTSTSQMSHK
jgi:MFS family permease